LISADMPVLSEAQTLSAPITLSGIVNGQRLFSP
jgi:hypothetical protein